MKSYSFVAVVALVALAGSSAAAAGKPYAKPVPTKSAPAGSTKGAYVAPGSKGPATGVKAGAKVDTGKKGATLPGATGSIPSTVDAITKAVPKDVVKDLGKGKGKGDYVKTPVPAIVEPITGDMGHSDMGHSDGDHSETGYSEMGSGDLGVGAIVSGIKAPVDQIEKTGVSKITDAYKSIDEGSNLSGLPDTLDGLTAEIPTIANAVKPIEAVIPGGVDAYPGNLVSGCGGEAIKAVTSVVTPVAEEVAPAAEAPAVACPLTSSGAYPEKILDSIAGNVSPIDEVKKVEPIVEAINPAKEVKKVDPIIKAANPDKVIKKIDPIVKDVKKVVSGGDKKSVYTKPAKAGMKKY